MSNYFTFKSNKPMYLYKECHIDRGGSKEFMSLLKYLKKEHIKMALFKTPLYTKKDSKAFIYSLHTNLFNAQLCLIFNLKDSFTDVNVDKDIERFTVIHKPSVLDDLFMSSYGGANIES